MLWSPTPPFPRGQWAARLLPKILTCSPDLITSLLSHLHGSGLSPVKHKCRGLVSEASANSSPVLCFYLLIAPRFGACTQAFMQAGPTAQDTLCPVCAWENPSHSRHPSRATPRPYRAFARVRRRFPLSGGCSAVPGLEEWPPGWIPPTRAPQPSTGNTSPSCSWAEATCRDHASSARRCGSSLAPRCLQRPGPDVGWLLSAVFLSQLSAHSPRELSSCSPLWGRHLPLVLSTPSSRMKAPLDCKRDHLDHALGVTQIPAD